MSYAPSLSVKLFRIILTIIDKDVDLAKSLLHEFVLEHPNKSRMVLTVFDSVNELSGVFSNLQEITEEIKNILTTFKDKNIRDTDYKLFKLSLIRDEYESRDERVSL